MRIILRSKVNGFQASLGTAYSCRTNYAIAFLPCGQIVKNETPLNAPKRDYPEFIFRYKLF
jgi:hypothetical protein